MTEAKRGRVGGVGHRGRLAPRAAGTAGGWHRERLAPRAARTAVCCRSWLPPLAAAGPGCCRLWLRPPSPPLVPNSSIPRPGAVSNRYGRRNAGGLEELGTAGGSHRGRLAPRAAAAGSRCLRRLSPTLPSRGPGPCRSDAGGETRADWRSWAPRAAERAQPPVAARAAPV